MKFGYVNSSVFADYAVKLLPRGPVILALDAHLEYLGWFNLELPANIFGDLHPAAYLKQGGE
jgi:hypothetical protein